MKLNLPKALRACSFAFFFQKLFNLVRNVIYSTMSSAGNEPVGGEGNGIVADTGTPVSKFQGTRSKKRTTKYDPGSQFFQ